jgi:hypothetical protein
MKLASHAAAILTTTPATRIHEQMMREREIERKKQRSRNQQEKKIETECLIKMALIAEVKEPTWC